MDVKQYVANQFKNIVRKYHKMDKLEQEKSNVKNKLIGILNMTVFINLLGFFYHRCGLHSIEGIVSIILQIIIFALQIVIVITVYYKYKALWNWRLNHNTRTDNSADGN